ncbi:PIH1 family, partial [Baffinella frigidus]
IVPEAGFVVKTRALETNEKVFINFCKSPKVKSFSKDADPNDPSVERVRIPLSLGPARNDLDKGGDACVVYDVVFNTEVMDQAIHNTEFKEFLIGLGLGW